MLPLDPFHVSISSLRSSYVKLSSWWSVQAFNHSVDWVTKKTVYDSVWSDWHSEPTTNVVTSGDPIMSTVDHKTTPTSRALFRPICLAHTDTASGRFALRQAASGIRKVETCGNYWKVVWWCNVMYGIRMYWVWSGLVWCTKLLFSVVSCWCQIKSWTCSPWRAMDIPESLPSRTPANDWPNEYRLNPLAPATSLTVWLSRSRDLCIALLFSTHFQLLHAASCRIMPLLLPGIILHWKDLRGIKRYQKFREKKLDEFGLNSWTVINYRYRMI